MSVDARYAVLAAALLALTGCGEHPEGAPERVGEPATRTDSAGVEIVQNASPRWSEATRWTLSDRPTLTIRSAAADDRSPLVEPVSAYRTADGDYVVADGGFSMFNEILTFSSRGRLRSSFGGSGQGPGEFVQIWWALPYRGDSIAVYDVVGSVSIFGPDGELGRSVRLPQQLGLGPGRVDVGTSPWSFAVYPDGSFLAAPRGGADPEGTGPFWFRAALLRVDPHGARWDTLGVYPVSQMSWDGEQPGALPFELVGQRALRGDELVFGTGETWEIEVRDRSGALKQIIRRPGEPVPVSDADMEAWRAWHLGRIASSREGGSHAVEREKERLRRVTPREHKPLFSHLLVDSAGNIWAEGYRWAFDGMPPDPRPTTWSVFDRSGEWLGDVTVPERVLLRTVGTDHAIGFYVDEYDARHVQVFDLEKG